MTGAVRRTHQAVWGRPFEILTQAEVDGDLWYTIACPRQMVAQWVREQNPDLWVDHRTANPPQTFDIQARLLTLMALTWGL
jgi:hypothetical protein